MKIIKSLAKLIFPPICISCEISLKNDKFKLCPSCWQKLHLITPPYCAVLGVPLQPYNKHHSLCYQALMDPPPFKRLRSAFLHQDIVRKLVSNLKFHDKLDLVPILGQYMIIAGEELIKDCDIIIPIPLHYWRFFIRHYNQAGELAKYIAKASNKTFSGNILYRKIYTKPQTTLTHNLRKKNVKNAFAVNTKHVAKIKNKNILLIDDVYTTGSTVKAATKLLLKYQAKNVDILTLSHKYHI